jgi:hypothetical protein
MTAIFGLYPGVGKTTSIKNSYNSDDITLITPYNLLCQKLRDDGFYSNTLHIQLGISLKGNDDQNIKGKKDNHNVICFDEVLLYNEELLQRIYYYMLFNPEKKFYCTGDLQQLKPISSGMNNIKQQGLYFINCINILFNNRITLKINKRLKTEEDRIRLVNLKNDIFNTNIDVMDTFKKYGFKIVDKMDDVTTMKNITYYNFRSKNINRHVYNKLYKVDENKEIFNFMGLRINKDTDLICKKYKKINKDIKIYTNYVYKLKDIDINDQSFTVYEPSENTDIELDIKYISNFRLSFSQTCYSVQGLSINEPYTIFDCNTPRASREWVWTALTRSTDFNNVYIYEHSINEQTILEDSLIKMFSKHMIESYKQQDIKSGRTWDDKEYISSDWIINKYYECDSCCLCYQPLEFNMENKYNDYNLSVDRINNSKAHTKSNCQLMCLHCNISKK